MTTKQTSADNLRDMIRNLGATPKGSTISELLDQLETIVPSGGGGTVVTEGSLNDDDISEVFDG